MKKLNKAGPSTDPWGTPLVTGLCYRTVFSNLSDLLIFLSEVPDLSKSS